MFNERLGDEAAVARALQGFGIVCLMRERTPFPRSLIEKLPDLKLIVTTGLKNASIDVAAAKDRGILVCGTEGAKHPTAELAIGLMIDLARHISEENARMKAGEAWQATVGADLFGHTLGIDRAGQSRPARREGGTGLRHERDRLEPESDAGAVQGARRHLRDQGRPVPAIGFHLDPYGAVRPKPRAGQQDRSRNDEAHGLYHQHLARTDHRRGRADRSIAEQDHRRRGPRRVRYRAAAAGSCACASCRMS